MDQEQMTNTGDATTIGSDNSVLALYKPDRGDGHDSVSLQTKTVTFVATEEQKIQQKLDQALADVVAKSKDANVDSLDQSDSRQRGLRQQINKQLQELRSLASAKAEETARQCAEQRIGESERKVNELLQKRLADLQGVSNNESANARVKNETSSAATTNVKQEAAKLVPIEAAAQSTASDPAAGNRVAADGSIESLLLSMQRQLNEQTEKAMAHARTEVFEKAQECRDIEQRVQKVSKICKLNHTKTTSRLRKSG
ncbi:hypothetical protein FI667_g3377, partial [Globisporangium splendens]